MAPSNEEIGELKINKNHELSMANGKLLQSFKKHHTCQHCLGKSMKLSLLWWMRQTCNNASKTSLMLSHGFTKSGIPLQRFFPV